MEQQRQAIYKIEPWCITENYFEIANNYRNETTFTLSNGYIGTRGTYEEGYDFNVEEGLEGNFINGFYESENIRYGEWNFGFPEKSQSLLNLPNLKTTQVYLDGELFDMRIGSIENYSRILHMEKGIVTRSLEWTSPSQKKIRLSISRFVSFINKNRMAIRVKITPLNFSGEIKIVSILDADVENHTRKTNPLVDYGPFGRRLEPDLIKSENGSMYYQGHTLKSNLTVACGCGHSISEKNASIINDEKELKCSVSYIFNGQQDREYTFDKFMVYTSDLDINISNLQTFVTAELQDFQKIGYKKSEQEQIHYMNQFWENSDVLIEGDEALQQGIRFNLFHIMQSSGKDGRTGLGAKGLSGEGYEGHYFWDTEIYVIPVFVYNNPEQAKKLLDYRYDTLNQARDRAKVLGHKRGALYPWRTINGEEASTYFPLGTAQYHINGDIAYAFWLYITVTNDMDYLKERAAEVLCETARVWADVGSFAECREGRYCICAVTGPDEYNAIVDNNFYTNLIARENLKAALEALKYLEENDREAYNTLVNKIKLEDEEKVLWQKIADKMYFPYDEKREVYPLDDGFMMRKNWDESAIPEEKRHLLYENYHPLFVYRQKISKQADAMLGMYLYSNLFAKDVIKRNYDFYQEVTLHHSSLSTCIFGILASEIGYYEEAYDYFSKSARMDIDDHHNNFYAGIHAANMAGTWQAIVNGFAGLRSNGNKLELHPYLPNQWKAYAFKITYRGSKLSIRIEKKSVLVTLIEGGPIDFEINNHKISLNKVGGSVNEAL